METINYYEFPQIIERNDNTYAADGNGNIICEVFPLSINNTEEELKAKGFAKCDAPHWNEIMLVKETAWEAWEECFF